MGPPGHQKRSRRHVGGKPNLIPRPEHGQTSALHGAGLAAFPHRHGAVEHIGERLVAGGDAMGKASSRRQRDIEIDRIDGDPGYRTRDAPSISPAMTFTAAPPGPTTVGICAALISR